MSGENLTQHDYDPTTGGCLDCFKTVPIKEMDEFDNCFECQDKHFTLDQSWWHEGLCYTIKEIRFHPFGKDIDSPYTVKLDRVEKDRLEFVSIYLENEDKNLLVWATELL
jgi:hypothetical protein